MGNFSSISVLSKNMSAPMEDIPDSQPVYEEVREPEAKKICRPQDVFAEREAGNPGYANEDGGPKVKVKI